MRLLNVICSTNPEHGGVIEWIRQFGPIAETHGHSIEVASMDSPEAPWIGDFPIKVHALGSKYHHFYSPELTPWLKANARNYDAVIAHGLWRYASFGTWRALHETGIPYFAQTHGMLDPWFKHAYPIKHLIKWLYWPWTDYRVLRDARAVIFTCEQERIKARESFWLYKANELVTPIGIAAPQGDPYRQSELFFSRHPETRKKRLILFLGRIHQKKGCDILIDAFANLAIRHNDLQLVFAGPGQDDLVTQLKAQAANHQLHERITWAGMLSGDLKWGAFHAADIFALPSHQENFGIAVVEAMACGLPVLISNKVDIWKEILDDNAGLVSEDTVESTTQILESWLGLPEATKSDMRNNAIRCFENRFEITHAVHDLMSKISTAINPGSAPVSDYVA